MGRSPLAWMLVFVLAGSAVAQQRGPTFVTVVDPEGKPLPNAEVTFVFTPDMLNPWTPDIVRQTTDARGRVRCDLQLGRVYAAWAIGSADSQGRRNVSSTIPLVTAGRTLELATRFKQAPRRLRVRGHDAWHPLGATSLRWFPDAGEDVSQDLPWPSDNVVDLPPAPVADGCLALVDSRGELLVLLQVDAVATETGTFAAPMEVSATVRDTAGKPVADARIDAVLNRRIGHQQLLREYVATRVLRACGTTDEAGTLRMHLPTPATRTIEGVERKSAVALLASKPGFGAAAERTDAAGTVAFTLPATTVHQLRLVGCDERNVEVKAVANRRVRTAPSQDWRIQALASTERRENRWRLDDMDGGYQVRVGLGETPPALVVLAPIEKPGAVVDIDLTTMPPIAMRVLDPEGSPAACAFGITLVNKGALVYWRGVGATDQAGRATLRLQGGPWCVYASTGRAHALAIIDERPPPELTVRLEAMPTMRVRIADESGNAVVWARFTEWHGGGGRQGDVIEQQWGYLDQGLSGSYATVAGSDRNGLLEVPVFPHSSIHQMKISCGERSAMLPRLTAGGEVEVVIRE